MTDISANRNSADAAALLFPSNNRHVLAAFRIDATIAVPRSGLDDTCPSISRGHEDSGPSPQRCLGEGIRGLYSKANNTEQARQDIHREYFIREICTYGMAVKVGGGLPLDNGQALGGWAQIVLQLIGPTSQRAFNIAARFAFGPPCYALRAELSFACCQPVEDVQDSYFCGERWRMVCT